MKHLLWSVVLLLGVAGASYDVLAQTSNQSTTTIKPKTKTFREKLGLTYWSMFTGPAPGQNLDSSVDANGNALETGANYFQMFIGTYEVAENIRVGTQLRVSTDFRDDQFQLLSPRLLARFGNVLDNDLFSLSLQPMLEIPTTAANRGRGQEFGVLFAHNWSFKVADPKWTVFMMTMTNANFYKDSTGFRTTEFVVMPLLGYQFHKDWQLMGWAWFDWAHYGGSSLGLDNWGDNYARLGVNYSVTSNIQIYPCVQVFTDNISAQTTTLGLEISATL